MRETSFIEQNHKKWEEFENELLNDNKDPDKLSNILIQVTDDLAFARTFYPNRSVRVYLNNIAQQIFRNIYKNKKGNRQKLVAFWRDELPVLVYNCRFQLLLAFTIFSLSVAIGVVSTIYDREFPALILGEDYVRMTLENIKKGDPLAVYKGMNQSDMFLSITYNNVLVAFRTFIMGVFFAIGTLVIMVYNGIMLGTFQYFFYEKGLFLDSFLTIWLHGTLEISSIIISGASGLVLGKGLVFPGTYSRLQAFQLSAKQGLKLFIGIVPILIFAAFIEGFITRYTEVPSVVKGSLILVSLFFILFYFIYYPYLKGRGQNNSIQTDGKIYKSKPYFPELNTIKNNSEILKDLFFFYKNNFKNILISCLSLALAYTVIAYLLFKNLLIQNQFSIDVPDKIFLFFNYKDSLSIFFINSLIVSLIIYLTAIFFLKFINNTESSLKQFYQPILWILLFNSLLFLPLGYAILLLLVFMPIVFLSVFVALVETINPISSLGRVIQLIHNNWQRMMVFHFMLGVLSLIFMFLFISPVIYIFMSALEMFIYIDNSIYLTFQTLIILFTIVLGITLILPILFGGQAFFYFTLKEIREATHLRGMIAKLKTHQ